MRLKGRFLERSIDQYLLNSVFSICTENTVMVALNLPSEHIKYTRHIWGVYSTFIPNTPHIFHTLKTRVWWLNHTLKTRLWWLSTFLPNTLRKGRSEW